MEVVIYMLSAAALNFRARPETALTGEWFNGVHLKRSPAELRHGDAAGRRVRLDGRRSGLLISAGAGGGLGRIVLQRLQFLAITYHYPF